MLPAKRTALSFSTRLVAVLALGCWLPAPLAQGASASGGRGAEDKALADLVVAERKVETAKAGTEAAMAGQMLAFALSRAGDYQGGLAAFRRAEGSVAEVLPPGSPSVKELVESCELLPAIEAIAREAETRQIVILNEAHHVSRHRAFAQLLAARLRKLGFEYLACETFTTETDAMAKRGYVVGRDGYYTREPLFADFVRQSLRLGYVPIAYESTGREREPNASPGDAINQRETGQAANLVERIFQKNPKAKVFIYVGYSHLLKAERDRPGPSGTQKVQWMAGRLKAATGIDPLTVDQVALTDPMPGSVYSALIGQVFSRPEVKDSAMVLRRRKEPGYLVLGSYRGDADMQVYHRPTQMVEGRPDWLRMDGYRRPHPVPADLLKPGERRLIKAHYEGEASGAIAVDKVLVQGDEKTPPVLMLPAGEFRFSFENR
jgi:hypothetical protein